MFYMYVCWLIYVIDTLSKTGDIINASEWQPSHITPTVGQFEVHEPVATEAAAATATAWQQSASPVSRQARKTQLLNTEIALAYTVMYAVLVELSRIMNLNVTFLRQPHTELYMCK